MELEYSDVELLLTRPRAWQIRKILKVPAPISPIYFFGGTFHLAFSSFYEIRMAWTKPPSQQDAIDIFLEYWDARTFSDKEQVPVAWRSQAEEASERLIGIEAVKVYWHEAIKHRPLFIEQRFRLPIGEDVLSTRLDLVIEPNGMPVDMKTSWTVPSVNAMRIDMQPTAYATAIGCKRGLKDFWFHHIIKCRYPFVRVSRTLRKQKELDWFRDVVFPGAVAIVKNGVFICHPERCASCDLNKFKVCDSP